MSSKIGIGIQAQFDASAVEAKINALGQKIAQANKTPFNPISNSTKADLDKVMRQFDQLKKVSSDLNKRLNATGQGGASFHDVDWSKLYPDAHSQTRQMRKAFEYVTGAQFQRPGGGGPRQPPQGSGFGGMAAGVAQAGLRAAGPAGGVAAGALGTGMASGAGAGLMGLMGGMLALGVGKLVSGVMEKVEQAENNAIAYDRLKRVLGDVSVSFGGLKSVIEGSAKNLSITFDEAGRLSTQFAKLGNLSGDKYKTIPDEMRNAVGLSRAFGLDPSQGVGVMGQMRGIGVTKDVQDSRRFALLIGETIGKSGAFAKADEVMDALSGYANQQTRASMGGANVSGYAGLFSALVGSGIPGMDPGGAAALISRVNSSLAAGGAKGEASQFFTHQVGAGMGLDPIQTQIMREGGAFATNDNSFGKDSVYSGYMGGNGPTGGQTFLSASLGRLRGQYGSNKGMLAQATANHMGIGIRQAMGLLSIDPNNMGEMERYAGDLTKLSGNGIGNLSKALYGSAGDRQSLASGYLGRTGSNAIKAEDAAAIRGAMGDDGKLREVLGKIAGQYDQERTQGSDIRDSKNALDNIKTSMADKLVPLTQEIRHGIMYMAGAKDGKSPREVMAEVMRMESKDKIAGIKGDFAGQERSAADESVAARKRHRDAIDDLRRNAGRMSPTELAEAQAKVARLWDESARKDEEVRLRILELQKKKAEALQKETEELEKSIEGLKKTNPVSDPETTGSITSTGAFARLDRTSYGGGGGGTVDIGTSGDDGGTYSGRADFDPLFIKYGQKHGVDPALLKAIATKESGLRPGIVSKPNANGTRDFGLMQHNSRYLASRGLTNDWSNPERSIEEAAKLLESNIQRGGSVREGVRMYNGSGARAEAYANDVMRRYRGTKISEGGSVGTPMPGGAGAGRGSGSSYDALRITADPIIVQHINDRGEQVMPSQTIQPRVGAPVPFGAGR